MGGDAPMRHVAGSKTRKPSPRESKAESPRSYRVDPFRQLCPLIPPPFPASPLPHRSQNPRVGSRSAQPSLEERAARELVNALDAVRQVPELLHAIINSALVLVNVGPGVARRALWGDVPCRWLGNAVKTGEKTHICLRATHHWSVPAQTTSPWGATHSCRNVQRRSCRQVPRALAALAPGPAPLRVCGDDSQRAAAVQARAQNCDGAVGRRTARHAARGTRHAARGTPRRRRLVIPLCTRGDLRKATSEINWLCQQRVVHRCSWMPHKEC